MACTLYWTVPQLYRLTIILSPQLPRFCMDMIGIHFVCCFFSTHKSQANPQLASTTCQCVCVCVFGATAEVLRRRCSPRQRLPRRRIVFVLVPAVSVSAPSVSAKQPVLSAVRGCGCVVCLFNKTVKPYLFPLSHVSSTREQIRSVQ